MANAIKKPASSSEYAIYVYHKPTNKTRLPQWERVGATKSMKRAIMQARLLHRQKKYERIEVKERSFCSTENRFKGKTLRSYERKDMLSWLNVFKALKINAEHSQ